MLISVSYMSMVVSYGGNSQCNNSSTSTHSTVGHGILKLTDSYTALQPELYSSGDIVL